MPIIRDRVQIQSIRQLGKANQCTAGGLESLGIIHGVELRTFGMSSVFLFTQHREFHQHRHQLVSSQRK